MVDVIIAAAVGAFVGGTVGCLAGLLCAVGDKHDHNRN